MAHGKGWSLVKNEWHRVLTRLASLPYGLVLISHAQDKTIETRTGEYTKTQPSLPDRARNVVLGLVDIILCCDAVPRKDARHLAKRLSTWPDIGVPWISPSSISQGRRLGAWPPQRYGP